MTTENEWILLILIESMQDTSQKTLNTWKVIDRYHEFWGKHRIFITRIDQRVQPTKILSRDLQYNPAHDQMEILW